MSVGLAHAAAKTSAWYPLHDILQSNGHFDNLQDDANPISPDEKPNTKSSQQYGNAAVSPDNAVKRKADVDQRPAPNPFQVPTPSPEAAIDHLFNLLFEDPTNLQTNFLLVEAQTRAGDLKGASATLERVLLIDPDSKLARILFAEAQFSLGNNQTAKLILNQLISEADTPEDMKSKAAFIIQRIEESESALDISMSATIAYGVADNARNAASEDNILFLDLPVENTTSAGSESF